MNDFSKRATIDPVLGRIEIERAYAVHRTHAATAASLGVSVSTLRRLVAAIGASPDTLPAGRRRRG